MVFLTTFTAVLGTRPHYIKLAPLYHFIKKNTYDQIIIIDTGQHYDNDMSNFILDELKIANIDFNLGIKETDHGIQTGKMMIALEPILKHLKTDHCFVFGDTNSTIAGAIVARKLKISTSHIEAGIRYNDINMVEEINRRIADSICNYLFAPSKLAMNNLLLERLMGKTVFSGDIMFDAVKMFEKSMFKPSIVMQSFHTTDNYVLLTLHRPENVDNKEKLMLIIKNLGDLNSDIFFPCHPRTRRRIQEFNIKVPDNIILIDPLPYLELLYTTKHAKLVITDSGGLQKEAYYLGKRILLPYPETGWKELEEKQIVIRVTPESLKETFDKWVNKPVPSDIDNPYGNGEATKIIYNTLKE